MALQIVEFFGFAPGDPAGIAFAERNQCPFVGEACIKPKHGACSMQAVTDPQPVICCPNRLYAENFNILAEVSVAAFGKGTKQLRLATVKTAKEVGGLTGEEVAVFGKYWGGELPLPKAIVGRGSYYLDWILARIGADGTVIELTALEIQTIDTTGNYGDQAAACFAGNQFTDLQGRTPGYSNAGFNWENVNKRILPQVIYKGHALRREPKCEKGFFFACPEQVFRRIYDRLGGVGAMHPYHPSPGTVTFLSYALGPKEPLGRHRSLELTGKFTTTIDQVALAFTSPKNLPPAKAYEQAINAILG